MDILVISDSHGCAQRMIDVIGAEKSCDVVFFLGDGERDLKLAKEAFPKKAFFSVLGNCDRNDESSLDNYCYFCGHTFFLTHGHIYGAKYTREKLKKGAKSVLADVCCFGHTHQPLFLRERDGFYFINPGALCLGSYAVLHVLEDEITISNKTI